MSSKTLEKEENDQEIDEIINEIANEKLWLGLRYKLLKIIRRWNLSIIAFVFAVKILNDSEKYSLPVVSLLTALFLIVFAIVWDWKKTPQSPDLNTDDRRIVEIMVKKIPHQMTKLPALKRIFFLLGFNRKIMIRLMMISPFIWGVVLWLDYCGYTNLAYQIAENSLIGFAVINLSDRTRDSEISYFYRTNNIFSTITGNKISVYFLAFCNFIALLILVFSLVALLSFCIVMINEKMPDNIYYYGLNYFLYIFIFLMNGGIWRNCSLNSLLYSIINESFSEKKIQRYYQSLG